MPKFQVISRSKLEIFFKKGSSSLKKEEKCNYPPAYRTRKNSKSQILIEETTTHSDALIIHFIEKSGKNSRDFVPSTRIFQEAKRHFILHEKKWNPDQQLYGTERT